MDRSCRLGAHEGMTACCIDLSEGLCDPWQTKRTDLTAASDANPERSLVLIALDNFPSQGWNAASESAGQAEGVLGRCMGLMATDAF